MTDAKHTPEELARLTFVEGQCQVGGTECPMWDEWFQGCDNADPDAIGEERDPTPLPEWPFNPLGCERPDTCRHYRNSIKGQTDEQA